MSYKIKIDDFEGPFDLLLFFIERDELDIYDIPIAKITGDFLEYMHTMQRLNIDLASDFVLVAATLMRIKSRMLLPRVELNEEGEVIDPRAELVQKLLEYRRYKATLGEFEYLEAQQAARYERGSMPLYLHEQTQRIAADVELEHLSLFKLLRSYQQVLDRFKLQNAKIVHTVVRHNYSMEERHMYIMQRLQETDRGRLDFIDLFEECENRLHAIYTFLATLELLQQGKIQLQQAEGFNNFSISAAELVG